MVSAEYLRAMLALFAKDPPDTDFQRGYMAALEELLRVAEDSANG
jgi:hypothetical protein